MYTDEVLKLHLRPKHSKLFAVISSSNFIVVVVITYAGKQDNFFNALEENAT